MVFERWSDKCAQHFRSFLVLGHGCHSRLSGIFTQKDSGQARMTFSVQK
jgi:hypothetical protein